MTGLDVTIEVWDVWQAWDGQKLKKWAVVHNDAPLITFVTHDGAVAWTMAMGATVTHDDGAHLKEGGELARD